VAIPGDIRDPKSCESTVMALVNKFGRLDVLVNGAAGNFLASASKLSSKGFKTVLEIDTLGTFNMSSAAFKGYMGANGGIIINISATLQWNGTALQVHAAAAKAAIDAMTKVLACEWGPHGIRVVGIVPGAIGGTEGLARLMSFDTANSKEASKAASSNVAKVEKETATAAPTVPCLRLGFVEDISNAGLYLASPAASYITGCNLVVDGGAYLTMPNHPFSMPPFVEAWRAAKL